MFVFLVSAVKNFNILGCKFLLASQACPKNVTHYVYKDFFHFSLILYLNKLGWWVTDLMTAKSAFMSQFWKAQFKAELFRVNLNSVC